MRGFRRDGRLPAYRTGVARVSGRGGRAGIFAAWLLGALLSGAGPAFGALPPVVGGEPLPTLAPMIEQTQPAVVNIATVGRVPLRQNPLLMDPFFRRFFNIPDQPAERRTESLGSGVVIDAERGLVVTNHHVIAHAEEVAVTLSDGRQLEGELIGSDPETDIALLRIPAEGLTALPMIDSGALRVGDFVVAIGNPFGLEQTVTSGIVSAVARSGLGITGYEDYIQTDASINPGNSGGALVNLRGELVGINTAIFSQTGGSIGIGFAIPTNLVRDVSEQLLASGRVQRGYIGAQLQDLDPGLAEAFGVERGAGAIISGVMPGSPAERSGLREGDVVVSIDERPVRSANELRNAVGLRPVGERLALEVVRDGERRTVKVELAPREESVRAASGAAGVRNPLFAGASFGDIPPGFPLYGKLEGVLVFDVERGSRAWRAGLRPNDVITEVDRRPVRSLKQFLARVREASEDSALLRVQRGPAAAYMMLR